jgi:pimeloyl-ACP methyl ester carboxylesterase
MKCTITILILLLSITALSDRQSSPAVQLTVPAVPHAETVVLLHGLVRSSRSMNTMEKELRQEGYQVINVDYPSRSAPIERLTEQIFDQLEPNIRACERVHFVTHSLGGILLRQYLQDHQLPNLGRVVMLAPPSLGSEVTDKLGNIFLYRWINGPAGDQLGTGAGSLPLRLAPPAFELGIIAGDRTINPILSLLIPGPDDGKVSTARAKPGTYSDYRRLHATHTFIMRNREAVQQTKHFLKNGSFKDTEVGHD